MNRIAFLLPYFGHLPANFHLWLKSCETNNAIDFIVLTDDHTKYQYPKNVKVKYCTFDEIKKRIQDHFDFPIVLDRPWRLALFKPAYGEIFEKELQNYEFWGFCDADLMWGDIRAFITDDLLVTYERIGTKGHASIYRNDKVVNARYKNIVSETANYKTVFSGKSEYSFDENGMDEIYNVLNIPFYFKPNFAHLEKYESSFYLKRLPTEKLYTNKYQVFLWENGKLNRVYLEQGKIVCDEYMYIHFFLRPMKYIYGGADCQRYVMFPDVVKPFSDRITVSYICKHGTQGKIRFMIKMIWKNRKKFTVKRIASNLKNIKEYKRAR